MLVTEVLEATQRAYTRTKTGPKLKYRCTYGPRKGQVRSSPAACNAPINIRKSTKFKQTKRAKATAIKIKTGRTKAMSTQSKRVARMNAGSRRKKI